MNVALLKESFTLVASRKEEFAHSFYNRLFTYYPETKDLFAHTDMTRQESSLVATLAMIVAGVERGENLVPKLQMLGKQHVQYRVTPQHYPLVGKALLETLQEYLGDRFTPAVQEVWTQAFEVISSQMIEGAKQLSADSSMASLR